MLEIQNERPSVKVRLEEIEYRRIVASLWLQDGEQGRSFEVAELQVLSGQGSWLQILLSPTPLSEDVVVAVRTAAESWATTNGYVLTSDIEVAA